MSKAAILCPGPSLISVEEDWGRYELVVGVTDAILKPHVPFDVFCLQESCGHKSQVRYKRWGETVHALEVDVWGKESVRDRWIHHWKIPEERVKTDLPLPGVNSFFYAVWRAAKTADEVDVYGADMAGDYNYDPRSGEPFPRTMSSSEVEVAPDWTRRWVAEKEAFAVLQESLADDGVEVTWVL